MYEMKDDKKKTKRENRTVVRKKACLVRGRGRGIVSSENPHALTFGIRGHVARELVEVSGWGWQSSTLDITTRTCRRNGVKCRGIRAMRSGFVRVYTREGLRFGALDHKSSNQYKYNTAADTKTNG